MTYQIIPNIIFLFAVLGIVLIILRHLPEAKDLSASEKPQGASGAPGTDAHQAAAGGGLGVMIAAITRKIWNFALEAKDLKPVTLAEQGWKQMFKDRPKGATQPELKLSPEPVMVMKQPSASAAKPKDERYYLDAIKQDPKNLGPYDELGKYYIDNLKFEDSRDVYIYLINHNGSNPTYHARLAYSFYRLKQFKRAADHYKRSLGLDSFQPNRYYNLGLTLEAYGDKPGSLEAFDKAISLDPKNVKFYTTLANILIKYGNRDRAREVLTKARTLNPSSSEILEKLNSLK